MKNGSILKIFAFVAIASIGFAACSSDDDTPVDPVIAVIAPTNVNASSADGAVNLTWTLSVSESQSNFDGYHMTIFNLSTNLEDTLFILKGISNARIDGMDNGTKYEFVLRSVDMDGVLSADFVSVTWSPAVRQEVDMKNELIRVYATTSTTYDSGLDLYNGIGKAEIIPQSGTVFQERGDLYVFAEDAMSALQIISPAEANNQGLETQFSSDGPYSADKLDDQLAGDPPADNTYTLKEINIEDAPVTTGRVYFGRIVRGVDKFYFRLLVKKGDQGKLIQGSGIDRFLEFHASFQDAANNPIAKH